MTKKLLEKSVLDEDSAFVLAATAKALKAIALQLYKLALLIEKLAASKDCFRTCRAPLVYGSFYSCDINFLQRGI